MCEKGMLASFYVAVTSGFWLLCVCACMRASDIMPILNSFFCVVQNRGVVSFP
jgi:hypothetical protein